MWLKDWQGLAGIEYERNGLLMKLHGMCKHRSLPIGCDDSQPCDRQDLGLLRVIHGAGVKGGDLIVIEVCGDEGLGGIAVIAPDHPGAVDSKTDQTI